MTVAPAQSRSGTAAATVRALVREPVSLTLSRDDAERMRASVAAFDSALDVGHEIYGVTRGFGPLVGYEADPSLRRHADGLIAHLCVGRGDPLPRDVTRLMVRLRLEGMRRGHSGVSPENWLALAGLWNRGFDPVVPSEGSVSASGDLVPLAHAARALSGRGEAWRDGSGGPRPAPALDVLTERGARSVEWTARAALAFVNGSSASVARACVNHVAIAGFARAAAALTGRIAAVLGAAPEPYHDGVALVRGHRGQAVAAGWVRAELGGARAAAGRPLQERYSLRCAPQVVGAVLDHLAAAERILLAEASGCSDNPVSWDGRVLHGGNFHAAHVALCSDQHALLVHQLAFLAERQLALVLDPASNGGLTPMLTPRPGPSSGLAGVQIAATSYVARIRQLAYPASLTALPTNLDNQDHVPMALNGANAVAELVDLGRRVLGSLAVAVVQLGRLAGAPPAAAPWDALARTVPSLDRDRPLADEVSEAGRLLAAWADGAVAGELAPTTDGG